MLNRGVPDEDIKIVPEEAITLGDFAQELFYSIHGQTKTPLVERISILPSLFTQLKSILSENDTIGVFTSKLK